MREIDTFTSLLKENAIKLIADVRMYPGSKRYPHFGREALAKIVERCRNWLRTFSDGEKRSPIQRTLLGGTMATKRIKM